MGPYCIGLVITMLVEQLTSFQFLFDIKALFAYIVVIFRRNMTTEVLNDAKKNIKGP